MAGGRSPKRKGNRGEREAAQELTRLTGRPWRRGLKQTRGGGQEDPDVTCEETPALHPEVKRGKTVQWNRAMKQALRDANGSDRLPFVMGRADHGRWMVMVHLDDLFELVDRLRAERTRPRMKTPPPPPTPKRKKKRRTTPTAVKRMRS